MVTSALARQIKRSPLGGLLSDEAVAQLSREPLLRFHWRLLTLFSDLEWKKEWTIPKHFRGSSAYFAGEGLITKFPVRLQMVSADRDVSLLVDIFIHDRPALQSFSQEARKLLKAIGAFGSRTQPFVKIYDETDRVFFIFSALAFDGNLRNLHELDEIAASNYGFLNSVIKFLPN